MGAGVEAYLFTWGRGVLGPYGSSLAFVAAGLLVALAGFAQCPELNVRPARVPERRIGYAVAALGTAAGLWLLVHALAKLLVRYRVRLEYSDIIPVIRIYAQRLLWGSDVYRPLTPELGYPVEAGYLPGTWLPFVLAEIGRFDYRWVALSGLLLGISAGWAWLAWRRRPWLETLLKALLPLGLTYGLIRTDDAVFAITIEALAAGYFLLLGATLLTRSVGLRALALALCLLSRYYVLLWVPLLVLLIFQYEGWRRLLLFGGLLGSLLVAGYFWPVWRHDPGLMGRVQGLYNQVGLYEWQRIPDGATRPLHPFNGLGLAAFFYPDTPTIPTLQAAIGRIRLVQLGALALTIAACVATWWLRRAVPRPPGQDRWFAVVSLKLFLVVFFAFLHVPYSYMMLVSVYFTWLLVVFAPGFAAARVRPPALGLAQ